MKNYWSKDELIVVLELYLRRGYVPPHDSEVVKIAKLFNRSKNSITLRLANYIACDPQKASIGTKGMTAGLNTCMPIWQEFYSDRTNLLSECNRIIASYNNKHLPTPEVAKETGDFVNISVPTQFLSEEDRKLYLDTIEIIERLHSAIHKLLAKGNSHP